MPPAGSDVMPGRQGGRAAAVVGSVTASLRPVTPLVVRVVAGVVMIAHATHFTPAEFGAILDRRVGLPFPGALAWTGTVLLYAGGALLIVGLLSRLVTVPVIAHMTLAIALVDVHEGLAPRSGGGMQVALLLIAALLVVFVTGPGPVSLDRLIGWDNGWSPDRA